MRAKEFIVEYNRDVTKRQYAQGITKALANSTNQFDRKLYKDYSQKFGNDQAKLLDTLTQDLLAKFEESDPTTNKLYTPWIAREYAKGNIKALEDLSRITTALTLYDRYKNKKLFIELFNKPEYKDIFKLTADTLEDIGMELANIDDKDKKDKDLEKGDAEVFYEDNDVRVIHPKDKAAACYYGQGTRWCTAATKGENLFDTYNKNGPLYIIIPKKPKYKGEKYQLHISDQQFMDERDDPVSLSKLKDYPGFLEYIKNFEKDLIIFIDPKEITNINKKIGENLKKIAQNAVSDIEASDAKRILENLVYLENRTGENMLRDWNDENMLEDGWLTVSEFWDIYIDFIKEQYVGNDYWERLNTDFYISKSPNTKEDIKWIGKLGDYYVGMEHY